MSDAKEADLLLELAAHLSQLRTHRRAVVAILDRSQGTLELVSRGHIAAELKRDVLTEM